MNVQNCDDVKDYFACHSPAQIQQSVNDDHCELNEDEK